MPLTHEQRRERRRLMAEAVKAGEDRDAVAARFGVHRNTVNMACAESQVVACEVKAERDRKIAEAVAGGMSRDEAALTFNVRRVAVDKVCTSRGLQRMGTMRDPTAGASVTAAQWASVDWNLRDTDIATLVGVTRERVRQVRKRLNKPKSAKHHQHPRGIWLRAWLETNRSALDGLTGSQIAEACPRTYNHAFILKSCRELGIKVAVRVPVEELVTRDSLPQFVSVVAGRLDTPCWEWGLAKGPNGYGIAGRDSAHRFVYRLFNGEIPDDKPCVLHKCDNPPCVNPEHLYAGTAADNSRDFFERGGRRQPPFDAETADQIRRRFHVGERAADLATEFGRTLMTIYHVVNDPDYGKRTPPGESGRMRQVRDAIAAMPGPFTLNELSDAVGAESAGERTYVATMVWRLKCRGEARIVRERRGRSGAVYERTEQFNATDSEAAA